MPIRPSGPIIHLCGCCGTEHNISEQSFCLERSKFRAYGKENHWRKVCRLSKSDKKGKTKHGRQKSKPPKGKSDRKKYFYSLEASTDRFGGCSAFLNHWRCCANLPFRSDTAMGWLHRQVSSNFSHSQTTPPVGFMTT